MAKDIDPILAVINRTKIDGQITALAQLIERAQTEIHELQASKGFTMGSAVQEATPEGPKRRKSTGRPLSQAHKDAISKSKKKNAADRNQRWVGKEPPATLEQLGAEPESAQALSTLVGTPTE
jgi:hypothetical protein